MLPSKHEFYARYDPIVRAYKGNDLDRRIRELHDARPPLQEEFNGYQRRTTTVAHLLRRSGDFPLSEARSQHAHVDVSKYFVDRAARLARTEGAVGLVVPSVLYNGDGCVGIRRFFLNHCAVQRFYGFENRRKIFPIHSSYKFVDLVFRKGDPAEAFDAAFMRHDMSELEDRRAQPWIVRLTRKEVETLSPETLALLEYRSPRDQEIVHKMHQGRPTLGSDEAGSWGATFVSWRVHDGIYNSAEDKDLWTDPATGRLYSPPLVLGHEPKDLGETIERMREKGFWPIFEGKHFDQFMIGIRPNRWWLSLEAAEQKYAKLPQPEPTLVFRRIARNTDERTLISTVLPARSGGGESTTAIRFLHVTPDAGATLLNSIVFDWLLRQRSAGSTIAFTYMRPMPVPRPDVVNSLPVVPTHLAWACGIDHITDAKDLWPLLWEANRAVAEAYGLTPDDFEHILNAFPVFARKRPAFFAFFRERLVNWMTEILRGK